MDKRVLLVGWGFPPNIDGGLDIHVKNLFEGLKELDVDVTLALPEENAPDREDVIGLKAGDGDMMQRARVLSAEVAKLSEDFDIVHTHDWFGAEAGFKAKKYSETDWISTIHSLSNSRSRNSGGRIEEMEKVAVEESNRVTAVSEKLGEEIEEKYGRKPEIVRNGFSRPESTGKDMKKELGIENDMIFFVGRHAEQKGLEHLLYGFQKFLEENTATLVIGGDGHMTEALKEFTEILEIREKVIFTGFIPDRELGDCYMSADLFVSPSINEPFGLTITEALESGTPVVATESGVEEVLGGKNIVNISPDSDSIAEGLEKGLKKNFESFEARSWSEMAEEFLDIYKKL